MQRDYVIVCNEHSGYYPGVLLFWGELTEDNAEKRSYGGYTSDLDKCEKYTLEEVKRSRYHFPVYDGRMTRESFKRNRDVAIKISQLSELGYVIKRFAVKV
ncbi:hypothetical protein [[Clostridium] symbiosum]|uniref:hypothetical protein n=1 Tax=Clostridium symbiosum TaxID=1512 RepID=UPI00214C0A09|nr:hypothetical protein [[Clostridium] symbiosum]MCR1941262.1 hypothetical protein [[Clostridium] symbiosum]